MCRAFFNGNNLRHFAQLCTMRLALLTSIFSATLAMLFTYTSAKADVGETHDLKIERENLLALISAHQTPDSLLTQAKAIKLIGLYDQLYQLDQRIMASMNETIVREQDAKARGRKWQSMLGKIAVVWGLIILAMYALHRVSLRMHQPLDNETPIGFYKRSAMVLISQIAPQNNTQIVGKINPIVAFGVVGMALSLLMVLMQML